MSATGLSTMQKVATSSDMPARWNVVIHNDDFTPMNFVSVLVMKVFNLCQEDAMGVSLKVHNTGRASLGPYTKEIAISKARLASIMADESDHPLLVTALQA